jgi:hypothetical protein
MSSQILHIRNHVIHVPSVASFQLTHSLFLRRPALVIRYFTGEVEPIFYNLSVLGTWTDAKEDVYKLQTAYTEVQKALAQIPMYEEPKERMSPEELK